jgi:hypothetical protein
MLHGANYTRVMPVDVELDVAAALDLLGVTAPPRAPGWRGIPWNSRRGVASMFHVTRTGAAADTGQRRTRDHRAGSGE